MMEDWLGLKGRKALVTGGAQGIGRSIVLGLRAADCAVAVIDHRDDTPAVVARMAEEDGDGPALTGYRADVRDRGALQALYETFAAEEQRISVVVANAGINIRKPAMEFAEAELREVLDTNLLGVMNTLQIFAPLLFGQPQASIVVTSSAAAIHGMILRAPYAATKAGLSGLVRALAMEWGQQGVNVNAVGPGIIETPLTRRYLDENPKRGKAAIDNAALRRLGTTEEVADTVVFLASRAARFVTGQTLYVDGGITAGSDWW